MQEDTLSPSSLMYCSLITASGNCISDSTAQSKRPANRHASFAFSLPQQAYQKRIKVGSTAFVCYTTESWWGSPRDHRTLLVNRFCDATAWAGAFVASTVEVSRFIAAERFVTSCMNLNRQLHTSFRESFSCICELAWDPWGHGNILNYPNESDSLNRKSCLLRSSSNVKEYWQRECYSRWPRNQKCRIKSSEVSGLSIRAVDKGDTGIRHNSLVLGRFLGG